MIVLKNVLKYIETLNRDKFALLARHLHAACSRTSTISWKTAWCLSMGPRGFANALTEVTTAMAITVVRARRHVEGPNLVKNSHHLSSLAV